MVKKNNLNIVLKSFDLKFNYALVLIILFALIAGYIKELRYN